MVPYKLVILVCDYDQAIRAHPVPPAAGGQPAQGCHPQPLGTGRDRSRTCNAFATLADCYSSLTSIRLR